STGYAADRSVSFSYITSATAPFPFYHQSMEAGVFRTQTHLLQTVTMNGPAGVVRTYSLSYADTPPPAGTGWPVLQQVQECAGAPRVCTQPTTFVWQQHSTPVVRPSQPLGAGTVSALGSQPANVIDPVLTGMNGHPPYQTQVGQILTV